jgi:FkbM family methyltransferase
MRLPPSLGALAFWGAWLVPWRPVFRARARASGLVFFVHRRDDIGRHIAKYGEHEPVLTRFIAERLAAGAPGIFIDAGANLGWHTLHAARHSAIECVVAFEPDPFNASLLARNLKANGIENVIVRPRALGAADGTGRLYRYKSSNLGRHSLICDHGLGSSAVAIVGLDRALEGLRLDRRPIRVLKIDVEGYDPAVIAGAAGALARTETVILEYSPALSRAAGLSLERMLTQLDAAGFSPARLDRAGAIEPLDLAAVKALDGVTDLVWTRRPHG